MTSCADATCPALFALALHQTTQIWPTGPDSLSRRLRALLVAARVAARAARNSADQVRLTQQAGRCTTARDVLVDMLSLVSGPATGVNVLPETWSCHPDWSYQPA